MKSRPATSKPRPLSAAVSFILLGCLSVSCYSTRYARSVETVERARQVELQWDASNLRVTAVDDEEISRSFWTAVGVLPACRVMLSPGAHRIRVKVGGSEDTVTVSLEAGRCHTVDSWTGKYIGWLPVLGVYSAPGSGGFVIVDGCNMTMSKSGGKVIAIGGRPREKW